MSDNLIQRTASAYDYPLLIKHLLQTPLVYTPNQEIVYRDLKRYNYTTLNQRIARLANALTKLGVKAGDTVAVMDYDSHRYLECFFAIPMLGAVLHTINMRLPPEQILYTINHAEDSVILLNSDFLPLLGGVADKLATVKKFVVLTDAETYPETSLAVAGEYEHLLAESAESFDFPDFDENTRATTFYTTGTTGLPKGVYFSHRQLVLHTLSIITALNGFSSQSTFNSKDVYMPLTPMFHVHAWGVPYAATLLGLKQVYPGRYEPEILMKLIVGEKVTFSHCVSTILQMIVNSPAVQHLDLSNWKVVIGGGALSHALCEKAMAHNINVYAGYGLSETCPGLSIALLKPEMLAQEKSEQVETRCFAGLPLPFVQFKTVDADDNEKETGEIVVRSPWLTQGYFKENERSEELWRNGWMHTGDVGRIDEEGYLHITDRIKDVIKTAGEWISSLELENLISQHSAVKEVAVIGVPDQKWGERPLAVIVPGNEVSEKDFQHFFKEAVNQGTLPKWGILVKVAFAEDLPKTSVGKLDKKVLREMYTG